MKIKIIGLLASVLLSVSWGLKAEENDRSVSLGYGSDYLHDKSLYFGELIGISGGVKLEN